MNLVDGISNSDKYIYINKNSLHEKVCQEIIEQFESEATEKKDGVVFSGMIKDVKDTTDHVIEIDDKRWDNIRILLANELKYNLNRYANQVNGNIDYKSSNNHSNEKDFVVLNPKSLVYNTFMIQKYQSNKGRYIYHNDFRVTGDKYRVLTYLWYLNDVEIGGETAFNGDYKIKPETGKLILFPATWTYPHCGKMPLSGNKYIITGWLYSK